MLAFIPVGVARVARSVGGILGRILPRQSIYRWGATPFNIITGRHRRPSFLMAVPTFGTVSIEFMAHIMGVQPPVNAVRQLFCPKGEEIGVARNMIAEKALQMADSPSGLDYVLMMDDDVLPPPDGLLRLQTTMERNRLDIVSGLYYLKGDPPCPMMWRPAHMGWMVEGDEWKFGEVVEVGGTGCGFTLFRPDVFRRVEKPWFKTGDWDPDAGGFNVHTEDTWFYGRARAAGYRVFVDTNVRCGHIDAESGRVF